MNLLRWAVVLLTVLGLGACNKPGEVNVLPPPAPASATPQASQATDNTRVEAPPSSAPASSK